MRDGIRSPLGPKHMQVGTERGAVPSRHRKKLATGVERQTDKALQQTRPVGDRRSGIAHWRIRLAQRC